MKITTASKSSKSRHGCCMPIYWEHEPLPDGKFKRRLSFLERDFQNVGAESAGSFFKADWREPSIFTLVGGLFRTFFPSASDGSLNPTAGLSESSLSIEFPTQYVVMCPFPFTATFPLLLRGNLGACSFRSFADTSEHWILPLMERCSIRDAVFIVSPNNPYRGLRDPMTLLTT